MGHLPACMWQQRLGNPPAGFPHRFSRPPWAHHLYIACHAATCGKHAQHTLHACLHFLASCAANLKSRLGSHIQLHAAGQAQGKLPPPAAAPLSLWPEEISGGGEDEQQSTEGGRVWTSQARHWVLDMLCSRQGDLLNGRLLGGCLGCAGSTAGATPTWCRWSGQPLPEGWHAAGAAAAVWRPADLRAACRMGCRRQIGD